MSQTPKVVRSVVLTREGLASLFGTSGLLTAEIAKQCGARWLPDTDSFEIPAEMYREMASKPRQPAPPAHSPEYCDWLLTEMKRKERKECEV